MTEEFAEELDRIEQAVRREIEEIERIIDSLEETEPAPPDKTIH